MTLAIVLPPRGDPLDLSRFFKLTAQRHSYRVNIFDVRQGAEEWLESLAAGSGS